MSLAVEGALRLARNQGLERLDAQLLLSHVLGLSRAGLVTCSDQQLSAQQQKAFGDLVCRRADQVPLAYLTGHREFYGLDLRITPDVLDPRPDTETLVDWALEELQGLAKPASILDLGTGSGAIALALKARRPELDVHALDASPAALEVAGANAQRLQLPMSLHRSNWWESWTGPKLHLAVSNPPYIAANDPHLHALRHEPRMALTPQMGSEHHHDDGLGALSRVIMDSNAHLLPGAWLLLEHGHDQAEAVATLLRKAGFEGISHRRDLAGHIRCTGGHTARSPALAPASGKDTALCR